MNKLIEAHYFKLPAQGNIYTLAVLNLCSGVNKFIVASLKRKLFYFEYVESSEGILKPFVKEISCTYIPNPAEIIAIDAFNKSKTCDDFQIGITIYKSNPEGKGELFFNIYAEQDLDNNHVLNMDSIAQNCLMVELNFMPYYLTHTSLPTNPNETVWLLSGDDYKIHMYREDPQNHSYNEVDVGDHFPELAYHDTIVMTLDIHHFWKDSRRVTVCGCECGLIQLSVIDSKTNKFFATHCDIFDGPITKVMLFSLTSNDIVPPENVIKKGKLEDDLRNDLHLLVCSSNYHPSMIYMYVEDGFSEKYVLDGSNLYDVCLCGCAADIDMDGCNEIVVGTYGHKILMYDWRGTGWYLSGLITTDYPVHGLRYVDLAGDGVCQLIVQTLRGVHIYQHDPEKMSQLVLKRMKRICGINDDDVDDEQDNFPLVLEELKEEDAQHK